MEYLQLQEEKIDRERKKKIMEENQRQREIEDLKFKKILEEMELQRKQRELE